MSLLMPLNTAAPFDFRYCGDLSTIEIAYPLDPAQDLSGYLPRHNAIFTKLQSQCGPPLVNLDHFL
jgi:hypothetical protein